MRRPWFRRLLIGLAVLPLLFIAAALAAPQFEASALRQPLQAALSEVLNRPVTLGSVHYNLFPAIGLTATDLVIPEDAAFGLEPVAYVTELQVGIHWSSVFRRRLVFSSIRLVEASVNLSRDDALGWNAGILLRQVEQRMREQAHTPSLSLRRGRINFRQGALKSAFFLNGVDLDISPPARTGGMLKWSFEASPARTDRSEQGFGRFSGEGRWRPIDGEPGLAEVEIELERSATSEVAILIAGRDLGLQGRLAARVQLSGPPSRLQLRGRLQVEGFDRGGRFAPRGREWTLPFEGALDLRQQSFELRTVDPAGEASAPLTILLSASSIFTRPRAEAAFTFDGIPASTFLDVARRLGAETPAGFSMDGSLHGALALPREGFLNGEVELRNAEVRLQDAGPVAIRVATVRMAGGALELLPAELVTPSGATAELAGRWSAGSLAFQARFPALPLDELNTALLQLPDSAAPPPLRLCREGTLGGNLRYDFQTGTGDGAWTADLLLQGASCNAPGLPGPIQLVRAPVSVRGTEWTVRAATVRWNQLDAIISLVSPASPARRLHLEVQAPVLDAARLEDAIRPAFERRSSFLDRTLRRQPPMPGWLTGRRLELDVRARRFLLAGDGYGQLRLHGFWDGGQIEVPTVEVKLDAASFTGRGTIRLGEVAPEYYLKGRLDRLPLRDASMDATIELRTSGFGRSLLERLRLNGRLDARGVPYGGGSLDWLAACYDFDASRPEAAQLRLTCLEARQGGEFFAGEPVTGSTTDLQLEIESARRQLTVSWPPTP
ncbi:MAG: AsmA family protein [Bryobacteraceae bacterium]|nr:hypothetical protein [Solibacteraceae bacterium]MCL4841213.1 AsmA family protein [Bryobacteraceae bacterium]MCO5353569.1 AsmA family protein [Bryobacteraceae bacterium]